MSTTTSTLTTASTAPAVLTLTGGPSFRPPTSSPTATAAATLRSLYTRAARAFLHRDASLTHSLLASAFAILHPPASLVPDGLSAHRRKWDILRITLETTMYASPPLAADLEALPVPLRANLVLAPCPLITSLYKRSLELFTPTPYGSKPDAAFLPSQILLTLVLSSLRLDCVEVGRGMVEDWLARRGRHDEPAGDENGHEKVLEMYCLHVLPQLEQWDYAKEFLHYESELPPERREHLQTALQTLHSQTLQSRRPASPVLTPSSDRLLIPPPRTPSPASSTSSSSSSLSTTSNHTAVPRTPRPTSGIGSLSAASLSAISFSSNSTITTRRNTSKSHHSGIANGHAVALHANGDRESPGSGSVLPRGPRAVFAEAHQSNLSTYAIIRAYLGSYLTSPKLTTLLLLFVVFPLLSFLLRMRRRRLRAAGAANASTVEQVRRRLRVGDGAAGTRANVLGMVWGEVVRVVGDTIKMGGSGLV